MITVLKLLEIVIQRFLKRGPTSQIVANFIFVNKPPDMYINHNSYNKYTIQTYLESKYPELANPQLRHRFYFAHRLDYSTSGLICIPININACKSFSKFLEQRKNKKYYVAVIRGIPSKESFVITKGIGRDTRVQELEKMCVDDNDYCESPRDAVTTMVVMEIGFFEGYPGAKVLIRPITGRRHQIRVHCSSLGHTIVGDYTYSNRKDKSPPRMFLNSQRLVLAKLLDVHVDDPFETKSFKKWIVWKRLRTLHTAYEDVDDLVKCSY